MALSRNHSTTADATFSATGKTNWEAAHAISGAVSGGIPYFDSTTSEASSALLAANGIVVGGGAGAAPATDANLLYSATGSPNSGPQFQVGSGSTTSQGWKLGYFGSGTSGIWSTGVTAGSTNYTLAVDSTTGYLNGVSAAQIRVNNAVKLSFTTSAATFTDILQIGNTDTGISRQAANQLVFNGGGTGGGGTATSRAEINKAVTGIADNTATATVTVTVPNAAHSASIRVRLTGSMGAGGAIGANESTQDAEYMINVARAAGVNAVATIGAVVGQAAAASVAGANNAAVTGTISAISGAVGATNTFTINVTIAHSGGSSTNHTCFAFAELLNANSSGVTIA